MQDWALETLRGSVCSIRCTLSDTASWPGCFSSHLWCVVWDVELAHFRLAQERVGEWIKRWA